MSKIKDSLWNLRQTFKWKYKQRYNEQYGDNNKFLELKLLKQLVFIYNYDLVYIAIDYFFQTMPQKNANILLFSSKKFFPKEFEKLIINKDISYYIRHINDFSVESKKEIISLLDEYTDYTSAIVLDDSEIIRKKDILKELEEIKCSQQTLS